MDVGVLTVAMETYSMCTSATTGLGKFRQASQDQVRGRGVAVVVEHANHCPAQAIGKANGKTVLRRAHSVPNAAADRGIVGQTLCLHDGPGGCQDPVNSMVGGGRATVEIDQVSVLTAVPGN